jgi:AcrR family transcriptional regulator
MAASTGTTTSAPPTTASAVADTASVRAGKGEATRRSILRAAIARFGRDGYRATSVADIARDAGVGGTVAYAYFPNKEALFLAAIDDDAAALISKGLDHVVLADTADWRETLVFFVARAVDDHPLARRLLAGLEPEVTERVLGIPALADLRRACADRLREEQAAGVVRPDIDPDVIANGIVALVLSLLMSVTQVGTAAASLYAGDVAAVFRAALDPLPAS